MTVHGLLGWLRNPLGSGLAVGAMLQVTMPPEHGLEFDRHWQFVPPDGELATNIVVAGTAALPSGRALFDAIAAPTAECVEVAR